MSKTSREDFEALVRRSGASLTEAQIDVIYQGWGFVEPMLERIRAHGRERAAEPAHVFRPDIYVPDVDVPDVQVPDVDVRGQK
jgi:hypothetical protein